MHVSSRIRVSSVTSNPSSCVISDTESLLPLSSSAQSSHNPSHGAGPARGCRLSPSNHPLSRSKASQSNRMAPTVIEAPQPRVRGRFIVMRRGIASRAAHGGNPRQSMAALSGTMSRCRAPGLRQDMDWQAEAREAGGGGAEDGAWSRWGFDLYSEMRCDETSPGVRKKKRKKKSRREPGSENRAKRHTPPRSL